MSNLLIEVIILTDGVVDTQHAIQQLRKDVIHLSNTMRFINTIIAHNTFRTRPVTVPDLHQFVTIPAKHDSFAFFSTR